MIDKLRETGLFNSIDLHFAHMIQRLDASDDLEAVIAAFASKSISDGHICTALDEIYEPETKKLLRANRIKLPSKKEFTDAVHNMKHIGSAGERKPVIFEENRFYLYRYWKYECELAQTISEKVKKSIEIAHNRFPKSMFIKLFESSDDKWQKIAAISALSHCFTVISGGPGTGKTTTVAKMLSLLLTMYDDYSIALAAPTGKAAARMNESLRKAQIRLKNIVPADILKRMGEIEGQTIHRMLGWRSGSPVFKHNKDNHLTYDMVIVDEASMVDMALMAKLVTALKPDARIILLGDKDQLASVEAGSVLGDICSHHIDTFSVEFCRQYELLTGESALLEHADGQLQDAVVNLKKSYRFMNKKGIGSLAERINRTAQFRTIMKSFKDYGEEDGILWQHLPDREHLKQALKQKVIASFTDYITAETIEDALHKFDTFRLLAATRHGAFGVYELNRIVVEILQQQGYISPHEQWYEHRPVMILKNDYTLNLYNGDVGIIRYDDSGMLRAWFPASDDGEMRSFIPSLLPEHETVFAMTVHKSQGSEFDSVLLILPDRDMPVLTRELIYTGITRARECVTLMANQSIFKLAVGREVQRSSGLRERLWNNEIK